MESARDLDRISALPDELLHHILAFVADATAVTRTAVLSRRWRRVWIHAQRLALLGETIVGRRGAGRGRGSFVDFVDWVLAQRGEADIESLDIKMSWHDGWASPERIDDWLRYAVRRVVKSFSLDLTTNQRPPAVWVQQPAVELPSHGRMASIKMCISHEDSFRLPVAAAARYEALIELTLVVGPSFNEVSPGGGRTLGDFVSSCCPRLRKLHVHFLRRMPQLVIRSDALEELRLFLAGDLRMLDVTAPSLRVLCFNGLPRLFSCDCKVSIAAPRLEEIAMPHSFGGRRPRLDLEIVHGMASVRRLSDLLLDMHGPYCSAMAGGGLWLLENCPSVEHIEVLIGHPGPYAPSDGLVDLTSPEAAPFTNVRSMVVKAKWYFWDTHHVSSMSSLISRCPQLRSLTIDITGIARSNRSWKYFCDELDPWRLHQKFLLRCLEDVTIRGFQGADEAMDLLALLFESSNSIKTMTLYYVPLKRMVAEDDGNDTNTIDKNLMNMPCTDRGHWHFSKDGTWTWTWTCDAESA